MNEKRLMQIQELVNERNIFPNRMYIFREDINDEEQELIDEVIRLKKENERILNVNEQLVKECQEFEATIYKAVEYIKEHKTEITKTQANIFNEDRQDKPKLKVETFMWGVDDLLNILRGDKE